MRPIQHMMLYKGRYNRNINTQIASYQCDTYLANDSPVNQGINGLFTPRLHTIITITLTSINYKTKKKKIYLHRSDHTTYELLDVLVPTTLATCPDVYRYAPVPTIPSMNLEVRASTWTFDDVHPSKTSNHPLLHDERNFIFCMIFPHSPTSLFQRTSTTTYNTTTIAHRCRQRGRTNIKRNRQKGEIKGK